MPSRPRIAARNGRQVPTTVLLLRKQQGENSETVPSYDSLPKRCPRTRSRRSEYVRRSSSVQQNSQLRRNASCWSRVSSFFKNYFKISFFFFFNSLIPGSDVGTDLYTCIDLYNNGQILWASMSFYFMWNPFIIKCLFMLARLWYTREEFVWKKELMHTMFFLPFVTPIKNLLFSIKLYRLRFGMWNFKPEDAGGQLFCQLWTHLHPVLVKTLMQSLSVTDMVFWEDEKQHLQCKSVNLKRTF